MSVRFSSEFVPAFITNHRHRLDASRGKVRDANVVVAIPPLISRPTVEPWSEGKVGRVKVDFARLGILHSLVPRFFVELVIGRIDAAPSVFFVCLVIFHRGDFHELLLEFFDQFFEIVDTCFEFLDPIEGFVGVEADPLCDSRFSCSFGD